MNRWTIITTFRTGSTALCQYIAYAQNIPNYDELFHPHALLGDGQYGSILKNNSYKERCAIYKRMLSKKKWVCKAIGIHINTTILDMINTYTDVVVILNRTNKIEQLISQFLMGQMDYHWKSDKEQPNWHKRIKPITIPKGFIELFKHENSRLASITYLYKNFILNKEKIKLIQINYEDWAFSDKPLSTLAKLLNIRDKGDQFYNTLNTCRKLQYDHRTLVKNYDEVQEWLAEQKIPNESPLRQDQIFTMLPTKREKIRSRLKSKIYTSRFQRMP